jgi:hypothetical protein
VTRRVNGVRLDPDRSPRSAEDMAARLRTGHGRPYEAASTSGRTSRSKRSMPETT